MKRLMIALMGCLVSWSVSYADDPGFFKNHAKKLGFTAVALGHTALRSLSPKYQEKTDAIVAKAKDAAITWLAIPLFSKVQRIKDEGLSRTDVFEGTVTLGTLVGLGYHFKLSEANSAKTAEVIAQDIAFFREHKVLCGSGFIALGLLLFTYLEDIHMPPLKKFIHSLSSYQKWAIRKCSHMTHLLDRAHEDPQALHRHDPLHELLEDHQKELLEKAVEQHIIETDPLSMLDEF